MAWQNADCCLRMVQKRLTVLFFCCPILWNLFFPCPPQEQHSRLPFLKNFETLTRGHLGRLRKSSGRASPQSLRQARQGARGELQAMYAELEELQQPSWAAKQRARERVAAADRRPPGLPGGGGEWRVGLRCVGAWRMVESLAERRWGMGWSTGLGAGSGKGLEGGK